MSWEPARPREVKKLARYVPKRLPIGLAPEDRAVTGLRFARTFRGMVAKPDGSTLNSPLTLYVARAEDARPAGFPTEVVEIGDTLGELRSTSLGTNVTWRVGPMRALVAADARRDGVVVSAARGLIMPEDPATGIKHLRSVPRGFRVIASRWQGPVRGKIATARYRSTGGPILELTVSMQFIDGFDPLLAAVPVHADAAAAKRVRVRGADALYRTSKEPGFPPSVGSMMRASLSWLEHPNLLVTVSARAGRIQLDTMRRISRSLHRIEPEKWNKRFPKR